MLFRCGFFNGGGSDYDNVMAQLVEETTTPASIASFTDGANNLPVKELVCTINPTETGTGTKSSSNPYIIGGHTKITVTQTGVNIWNEETETGSIDNTTGQNTNNPTTFRTVGYIRVLPQKKFYVTKPNGQTLGFRYYDINKNFVSPYTLINSGVITIPNDVYYMRFVNVSTNTYNNDVSINSDPTDTAYHAYNGQTYNREFGQTAYGANLNATTGVLTVTRIKRGVSDLPFIQASRIASVGGYYFNADCNLNTYDIPQCKYTAAEGASILASELFNMGTIDNPYNSTSNCAFIFKLADNRVCVRIGITDIQSLTDFNSMKDNIEICYELETPFTIQLDPIEVKTLLGANNIYHDCNGNIKVTYRANGALYVAQH